jgi:GNAT superfamily N-acetyltransferase
VSHPPALTATPTDPSMILPMREDHRREMGCQIVHDSWHARGFVTPYLLAEHGNVVGYAAVGGAPGEPRDAVKELYLVPSHRGLALPLLDAVIAAAGATRIEAQTNDPILGLLIWDRAMAITSDTILFADRTGTHLASAAARLRAVTVDDQPRVFAHTREPVGAWGLELDGILVATGGLLLHYNRPYADIHMEVHAPFRHRGLGSYLVQELKRIAYASGHVPAARCHHENVASRRTLQRGGMFPCARIVHGRIVPSRSSRGPSA